MQYLGGGGSPLAPPQWQRAYSWIIDSTQDYSQMTIADVTKLDVKDKDHDLYPLMGYFCLWC